MEGYKSAQCLTAMSYVLGLVSILRQLTTVLAALVEDQALENVHTLCCRHHSSLALIAVVGNLVVDAVASIERLPFASLFARSDACPFRVIAV